MIELNAYKIMVRFLEDRYSRLPSDALGGLLGELTLLEDGRPADSAIVGEWENAVMGIK
jgi:hypothetical protein